MICECGCGRETNLSKKTGLPLRFVKNHHTRKPRGPVRFGVFDGDPVALIPLQNGAVTMVDDCEYDRVHNLTWSFSEGYVRAGSIKLHRFILGTPKGSLTDHRNRNPLDNRRRNLRTATHSQNRMNTGIRKDNKSGFKGVCKDPRGKKWMAQIEVDGVNHHLGRFDTPEQAHEAYVKAAPHLHGEFAGV